jgi:hypothetical protein
LGLATYSRSSLEKFLTPDPEPTILHFFAWSSRS